MKKLLLPLLAALMMSSQAYAVDGLQSISAVEILTEMNKRMNDPYLPLLIYDDEDRIVRMKLVDFLLEALIDGEQKLSKTCKMLSGPHQGYFSYFCTLSFSWSDGTDEAATSLMFDLEANPNTKDFSIVGRKVTRLNLE